MKQVSMLFLHTPGGTDAVIAQFRGLVCGIPTLKGQLEFRKDIGRSVSSEPLSFHHPVAQRSRSLLVLAGKVVLPKPFAYLGENGQGFPFRVQSFALASFKPTLTQERLNNMLLILFSDRREAKGFPVVR